MFVTDNRISEFEILGVDVIRVYLRSSAASYAVDLDFWMRAYLRVSVAYSPVRFLRDVPVTFPLHQQPDASHEELSCTPAFALRFLCNFSAPRSHDGTGCHTGRTAHVGG